MLQISEIPLELDDLELLRAINREENPRELGRLEKSIASGKTAKQIVLLCDELGRLRYKNKRDPNALINRIKLLDIQDQNAVSCGSEQCIMEAGYYEPSIEAIKRTRRLVALQIKDVLTPTAPLETHENYVAYFESFHPKVMEELIRNLQFIEFTQGCNGPCRSVCALQVAGKVQRHMPFKTIEWLFEKYAEQLKNNNIIPYYTSDLIDYQNDGKTGADIIDLYIKYLRKVPYISVVYRLDKAAIDFFFQLFVVRGYPIERISRLTTGIPHSSLQRLFDKLTRKADAEGYNIDVVTKHKIVRAFYTGTTETNKLLMTGNAIKEDTEEHEISKEPVSCIHGTGIRAGTGFVGTVTRPASKIFRYGSIIFTIRPDEKGHIYFPQRTDIFATYIPYTMQADLVLGPLFTTMTVDGQIVEREERSAREQMIIDISQYKWESDRLNSSLIVGDPENAQTGLPIANLLRIDSRETLNPENNINKLRQLVLHTQYILEIFKRLIDMSNALLEKYGNRTDVLFELICRDALVVERTEDEINLIKEILGEFESSELHSYNEDFQALRGNIQDLIAEAHRLIEMQNTKGEKMIKDGGPDLENLCKGFDRQILLYKIRHKVQGVLSWLQRTCSPRENRNKSK
ncbi:MAG: hypothetical protein WC285_04840 [Candidatus Gracilibacteria bacterium]|jgi:hypothetical protein